MALYGYWTMEHDQISPGPTTTILTLVIAMFLPSTKTRLDDRFHETGVVELMG